MVRLLTPILLWAVVVFAVSTPNIALAEAKYDFPRLLECGSLDSVAKILKEKYGEEILLQGSSVNKMQGHESYMILTVNSKSGSYTILNYYHTANAVCIIDGGELKQWNNKKNNNKNNDTVF